MCKKQYQIKYNIENWLDLISQSKRKSKGGSFFARKSKEHIRIENK